MAIEGLGGMALSTGMSGMYKPDAGEISRQTVSRLDKDGDGALSKEELGKVNAKLIDADSNGDGLIDQEELLLKISTKLEEKGGSALLQQGEKPDVNQIKQMIAQMSQELLGGASDNQSNSDLITQLLNELGFSSEEKNSFFGLLQSNGISLSA